MSLTPKDPENRVRRNKPTEFESLPEEGPEDPPDLPETYSETDDEGMRHEVGYLEATREWWDTWATSPQANRFAGTDWQRLKMLAPLVDAYHRKPNTKDLAEIRLNEERLGATAKDRQALRWRIDGKSNVTGKPVEAAGVPNIDDERAKRRERIEAKRRGDNAQSGASG